MPLEEKLREITAFTVPGKIMHQFKIPTNSFRKNK